MKKLQVFKRMGVHLQRSMYSYAMIVMLLFVTIVSHQAKAQIANCCSECQVDVKSVSDKQVLIEKIEIPKGSIATKVSTNIYVSYRSGNTQKFWSNLAIATAGIAVSTHLNTTNVVGEGKTQSAISPMLPLGVSVATLPSIWKNRPRGVPQSGLYVQHRDTQGKLINTWEQPISKEAQNSGELLTVAIDKPISAGTLEIYLQNGSKNKVYYWGHQTIKEIVESPSRAKYIPNIKLINNAETFTLKRISKRNINILEIPIEGVATKFKIDNKVKNGIGIDFQLPVNLKALSSPIINGANQTSGDCPEGMGWNDKTQECASICDAFDVNGKYLRGFCEDVTKGLADALKQAQEECSKSNGMHWDDAVDRCVPDEVIVTGHDCGTGHWDEIFEMCVPEEPSGECERNGGVWDIARQTCTDPRQECENNGGRWNGSSCDSNNNECNNGYDQNGNHCGELICNNGVDQYGNSCGEDASNDPTSKRKCLICKQDAERAYQSKIERADRDFKMKLAAAVTAALGTGASTEAVLAWLNITPPTAIIAQIISGAVFLGTGIGVGFYAMYDYWDDIDQAVSQRSSALIGCGDC